MAESSAIAFGQYLRLLRERRALSLQRVCELTRSSAETIDKGTLSRLERGQQTPSIYKLGPLCRIYEVSPGALIERMELDREVARLGRCATSGKSYAELHRQGAAALLRGARKWEAYAYFRDALPLASEEKRAVAASNLITAIRALGKNELALHELRELEASGNLRPAERALVHERMSNCHRCLGDMKRAEESAEAAATSALAVGDFRTLAFAYTARANVAIDQELWAVACEYLNKALVAYRDGEQHAGLLLPNPAFEAQTLLMLVDCKVQLGSLPAARRLALAAKRMSHEHELPLSLAYSELHLGRIDDREGETARARQRWGRAASLAARIDNQRLAFTIEMELYRQARREGDPARARASGRRLERLAPWIPKHIPAMREYEQWIAGDRARVPRTPAEGAAHEKVLQASDARARVGVRAGSSSRRHDPGPGRRGRAHQPAR